MAKSKYYSPHHYYDCDDQDDADNKCPNNPDLLLLRDAAADERCAILNYLTCAAETCFDEVFLDVAEDEMRHFVETMRLISRFDPVQAAALEAENLSFLVMKRPMIKSKWNMGKTKKEADDVALSAPSKKDLPALHCLTEAIAGELQAINKYQKYMNKANDPLVKEHFCNLMNDEKEHVAQFTAALFKITGEPLTEED